MADEPLRETMTLDEALARIPPRPVPHFWVGDVDPLRRGLDAVKRGGVTSVAHSPGRQPVWLVTYGEREPLSRNANFNSAIGGLDPTAYMDKASRARPVVLFIGPVHGHETEGVTGLVNLIHVLETGHDLRGRPQPRLCELASACRLLIVPCGNPDGMARFTPRLLNGMAHDDIRFWGQGTRADDTLWGWPDCKRRHPMRGEDAVGFLGCYYNEAGINPMHDEFFAPHSAEVAAILKVARDEGPDLAVLLHSHQNPPAVLRPAYVPLDVQAEVAALGEALYARLDSLGLQHGRPFEPRAEQGPVPASFNLTSAVYHTSGASAFTFECPHGVVGERAYTVSPEEILDIQLALYETMLAHALARHQSGGTAAVE